MQPRTLRLASALPLAALLLVAGCGRSGLYHLEDDGGVPLCIGSDCPDFYGFGPTDGSPFLSDGPRPGDDGPPRTDGPIDPGDGPNNPTDGPSDGPIDPGDGPNNPTDGPTDGPPRTDGPGCRDILEDCGNNKDDNCDGLVDCKDPECATDKRCFMAGVEICNNGVDDDKNGLTDCADPACKNFPNCQPHMCNLAMPDCKDPACVNAPACQNLVCKPTIDFGALAKNDAKVTRAVDTTGTVDVARTTCGPAGGGQVVTTFEVLANQTTVRLDFTQAMNADNAFALFRAGVNQRCDANPASDPCYDPKAMPSGTHSWILDAGHYYLVVLAVTKIHQGPASITLTTPPVAKKEVCNNGVDDDGNGFIDCADPACVNDAACAKVICKPDFVVGTLVPGAGGKQVTTSTAGGNPDLSLSCGGKGRSRIIQFSLAEAAGVLMTYRQNSRHVVSVFQVPPLGKACDAQELVRDCMVPPFNNLQNDFGYHAAGDYLLIVQAETVGSEGNLDITLSAYKNNGVELCHNNFDDDKNGLTDCADPACFNDVGCGPPICSPDVDFGVMNPGDPPQSVTLDLAGGVPHLAASCAKGGGRSRVVQYTLSQYSGLVMSCQPLAGNVKPVLAIYTEAGARDSCDKNELSCGDPQTSPFGCGWEWPNLQPGTYYLIMQAFQSGDEGKVDLTLQAVRDRALEVCNNGIDDDKDGFTDCADKKCALAALCAMKACKPDATIDPMPVNGSVVSESLDTRGKSAQAAPACEVVPGGGTSVVKVNLPSKATLKLDYAQLGKTNHVVAIYPIIGNGLVCEAAKAVACQATGGAKGGTLTFANLAAGAYWVIAAADQPGDEGPIIIDFSATP